MNNGNIFEFYDDTEDSEGESEEKQEEPRKDNPGIIKANKYKDKESMVQDISEKSKETKGGVYALEEELKKAENEGKRFNCKIEMQKDLAKGSAYGGRTIEDLNDAVISNLESKITEREMLLPKEEELSDSMPIIDGGEKDDDDDKKD